MKVRGFEMLRVKFKGLELPDMSSPSGSTTMSEIPLCVCSKEESKVSLFWPYGLAAHLAL